MRPLSFHRRCASCCIWPQVHLQVVAPARQAPPELSVTAAPLLARFLHVRRSELDRTLQVAGFAILLGWAMYTAFNATQAIFLVKAGPHAYPLFFVVLALAVWPMVALQGALTRRLGVGRTLRLTLVLNAVLAPILYIVYFISEAPTVAFSEIGRAHV